MSDIEIIKEAIGTIEMLTTGIQWRIDNNCNEINEADHEAIQTAEQSLTKLTALLNKLTIEKKKYAKIKRAAKSLLSKVDSNLEQSDPFTKYVNSWDKLTELRKALNYKPRALQDKMENNK